MKGAIILFCGTVAAVIGAYAALTGYIMARVKPVPISIPRDPITSRKHPADAPPPQKVTLRRYQIPTPV